MDFRQQTLNALSKKAGSISGKSAFVGFDGFVDQIFTPVGQRLGPGDQFTPIDTISKFANRIQGAAGKSTNIEIFPKIEKLGGNGPIMANSLLSAGMKVKYIGAIGNPEIHPIFQKFSTKTEAISIADPGITRAFEFNDGKLMFGSMASLDEITYSRLIEIVGEGQFLDYMSRADLVSLLNWTMIPHMTALLNKLIDVILPDIGPHKNRTFFFDLADPEKRSAGDLQTLLMTLKRFQNHGHVILGLNLKEANQVSSELGHSPCEPTADTLQKMASRIRQDLEIGTVIIHPTKYAVCATKEDTFHTDGPYTEKPLITTGAGDHFNCGFTTGHLLGLLPEECLTLGVAFAGYYVRKGTSPTLTDVSTFIAHWK